jgi:hypothetical protein
MYKNEWAVRIILLVVILLLGVRTFFDPVDKVLAQPARFDHVMIVSTGFLYKGQQGLLVMDKRNANVWFFPRVNDTFQNPVLILRLPFEKLDATQ